MTNNIKEIYEAYSETNMENPRVTESFAETQAKNKESRENLSYRKASPSAISQALRIVMENEGPRFVNRTGASLAALVGEVLQNNGTRCA